MASLLDELREDLAWYNLVDGQPVQVRFGWVRTLIGCWRRRGSKAVLLYRLAHRLHERGWRVGAAVLSSWAFRSCHAQIAPTARIEGGLRLPHPQGVIVGSFVEIGRMVTISQHVTLGGNFGKRDASGRFAPRIGDEVQILVGSVVGGSVEVGPRTIVASHSTVTRSIPGDVLAGGAPARVLRPRQQYEQAEEI